VKGEETWGWLVVGALAKKAAAAAMGSRGKTGKKKGK